MAEISLTEEEIRFVLRAMRAVKHEFENADLDRKLKTYLPAETEEPDDCGCGSHFEHAACDLSCRQYDGCELI